MTTATVFDVEVIFHKSTKQFQYAVNGAPPSDSLIIKVPRGYGIIAMDLSGAQFLDNPIQWVQKVVTDPPGVIVTNPIDQPPEFAVTSNGRRRVVIYDQNAGLTKDICDFFIQVMQDGVIYSSDPTIINEEDVNMGVDQKEGRDNATREKEMVAV